MSRVAGFAGRLLVALAIFLVAGEVLGRVLGIVDRLNGFSRLLYAPGAGPDLPYRLRAGVETSLLGVPVRVNALGFRGPEIAAAPAPGARRILVLGDSVVFGHGLAVEEAVPAALQRRLGALGRGSFEVVNGGVPGYDAVAAVRFLETWGLALEPAVVVVGVSLNDYDVAPVLTPSGILVRRARGERRPRWSDRSEFLTLLRWLSAWHRGALFPQLTAAEPGAPGGLPTRIEGVEQLVREEHLRFYRMPTAPEWDRLRGAWSELARLAAARRLRILVAIFPEGYQVGVPAPDLVPQQRLLAACREAGLECLDLQPAFAAAGGALFLDVQHPNARGHAVAAEAIAAALGER